MRTGFYNINSLDKETLTQFFKDAVMMSYNSHIEKLDVSISLSRQHSNEKSIGDMINDCSPNYHNICVDRSIQYENNDYGEIAYSIISGKYFLYIFVTLDNLKQLVDKYKLEME